MPFGTQYRRCGSCGSAVTGNCCGNLFADLMMWDAAIHGNPLEFLLAAQMGGGGGMMGGLAEVVLIEEIFDGDDGDGGGFFG